MLPAPRVQGRSAKYWQELVEELGSLEEHAVDHLEVRSVVAKSNK